MEDILFWVVQLDNIVVGIIKNIYSGIKDIFKRRMK
jgi:hypothetical protein